jgi:hypothetical protein
MSPTIGTHESTRVTRPGSRTASTLSAEYRTMMRWYPRTWRLDNEDAMLGILLEKAEHEHRDQPTTGERSALARAGLAQWFGLPVRTATAWGGLLVTVSGTLILLCMIQTVVPLTPKYSFPFFSVVPVVTSAILLLVGATILAFGSGWGSGIAGRSTVGRTALTIFGASWLVYDICGMPVLLGAVMPHGVVADFIFGPGLQLIFAAAAMVAAVSISRARVLHGFARWALLLVAVCDAVLGSLSLIPSLDLTLDFVIWHTALLNPTGLIILGLSYMLSGRKAQARAWLRTVNERW